jgi:hypothetical protein
MSSEESYEESSEEWTSAERIIVHHHPKRATRMPLLEAIRKNGEFTPVDRAALRAFFTNIIHRRGPSDSHLRGDEK